MSLTLSGFATYVQEDVPVTVGQSVTIPVAMKVGGVAETITVTGGTSVIESTRTASATTLNARTVEHIPNLGRKFEDLLSLTPGVSIVQGPDGDEITFAGQRGIFNNISLDGGDYNNGFFGEQAGGQRAAVDITLEAIKEFQVIATGAPAEFGRTAGGVVNVITKSGTNSRHGSIFHFQRLEALTGDLSDGTRLEDFHREQWGGTFGGPLKQDKAFFFVALEGITGNFKRPNLGRQLGDTPCPVANPNVQANEALINRQPRLPAARRCSRSSARASARTRRVPIEHPVETVSLLGKIDVVANQKNNVSGSWNFNHSRKENETFDVATYGASANGIEGDPARINVVNLNWFTTLSTRMLNEAHFTYSREKRPRTAVDSPIEADTGIGFVPTFRFGNPFFLQPGVDELIWRTQIQRQRLDRAGHAHDEGRRRVDAHDERPGVPRLLQRALHLRQRDRIPALRITAGARRLRPEHRRCADGTFVTHPTPCAGRTGAGRRPAAALPPGRGARRSGHRRDWRVEHHQRRVLAVRRRTSGSRAPTSRSTTACAGTRS